MGNVVHSTYTTGTRALPDIYARALGLVRIYQAKHLSLWYRYYVLLRSKETTGLYISHIALTIDIALW